MAVYTDVTDEELQQFLAGYDLCALLSYKGIAEGVENSNFLLHTAAGSFILTLYEKRVVAGDAMPHFEGGSSLASPDSLVGRAELVMGAPFDGDPPSRWASTDQTLRRLRPVSNT